MKHPVTLTDGRSSAESLIPEPSVVPWMLIVVAQQRSGTTALGRLLGSGEHVHNLGEVFHDDASQCKEHYFSFRSGLTASHPDLLRPIAAHQATLWKHYTERLRLSTQKPIVLLDIKYNSWHHFDPIWHEIGGTPALVDLVRQGNARVLHLVRRNSFAQACSALIAYERKVWHVSEADTIETGASWALNPGSIQILMEQAERQRDLFRGLFASYPLFSEIAYEELFSTNQMTSLALQTLSRLTGLDTIGKDLATPLRKTLPNLSRAIANVGQVLEYFDTTRWKEQAAEVLGEQIPDPSRNRKLLLFQNPDIETLTPWTRTLGKGRCMIHPHSREQPPARLVFRRIQISGFTSLNSRIRNIHEECRPLRFTVSLRAPESGLTCLVDAIETVGGAFSHSWSVPMENMVGLFDVIVSCELAPHAIDSCFSGAWIEHLELR